MEEVIDYTADIDFSELKNEVGRPSEESMKRVNLKPYLVESEFKRRFNKFYNHWEDIIKSKAKGRNREKYIDYMEEFYGEVLEKFGTLKGGQRRIVMTSETPMVALYKLTNLSKPNVFHSREDNDYFMKEMLLNSLK